MSLFTKVMPKVHINYEQNPKMAHNHIIMKHVFIPKHNWQQIILTKQDNLLKYEMMKSQTPKSETVLVGVWVL